MLGIIGIVVVFVMVFGGYTLAGGKFGIIVSALPFELMMIGGAALGAFLIANDKGVVRQTARDIKKVFKGPHWLHADYRDLLCLLYELIRLSRNSPVALEEHIETPSESAIFSNYPRILADEDAVEMICDTLRSISMNYDDPHQVEEVLDKRIEALHHHNLRSSHSLTAVADALPALGIVAAVLGIIKTMASIDQPPEILGKMIGGALVGTFLGVFLSYAFVAPMANKVKAAVEEDLHFYQMIREVLIANLHNHSTNICIEVGRQNTPAHYRPSFVDIEDALKSVKQAAS